VVYLARIYDEQCDIEADEQVPDQLEKQGEKPLMSLYDPHWYKEAIKLAEEIANHLPAIIIAE